MALKDDLLQLLRADPEFRDAARREILSEELLSVPARLEALTARVEALVRAIEELTREVRRLSDWQRDEQGRREGERYERDTIRHAYAIFGGGRSAAERPEDLERLRHALDVAVASPDGLDEPNDPFLADLLWLKGERIAVVEVSRQVDHSDMERADRRASTLRSAGLPALGIVIGRDWASEEAERAARERPIEWRVGEDSSAGYLQFRKAPPA